MAFMSAELEWYGYGMFFAGISIPPPLALAVYTFHTSMQHVFDMCPLGHDEPSLALGPCCHLSSAAAVVDAPVAPCQSVTPDLP